MPDPIPTEVQPEIITFEYQHTDGAGNPLIDPRTGKQLFTNLTGKDWKEIAEKEREAHIHVTRALYRERNQKPVPREAVVPAKQLSVEEERQAAADLQDPTKAREAARKLVGIESIEEQQKKSQQATDEALANKAAYQFMAAHLNDYYPCQANSAILSSYINENQLDPRVKDNYEIAFNECQAQLAVRAVVADHRRPWLRKSLRHRRRKRMEFSRGSYQDSAP